MLDLPAGRRFADSLSELRRRFRDWHEPTPALLGGDAAHAMTPHRGQGACQAREDAVALAVALADEPTVESELAPDDTERRPRSQAVARAARQAERRASGSPTPPPSPCATR
ncbi:FAD-dependent monooxygenase [Streptomyces sp. NPDC056049]|uniref:FAD-dependent monooxygenase n=1 Tax=Streptomyces sp. NPDC056049 TaxID=3345693 RepID=UPI0035D68E86